VDFICSLVYKYTSMAYIKGTTSITHNGLEIPKVPVQWTFSDTLGGCKARWALSRMRYTVAPGIYAVGNPGSDSPVLVSANYKLSFDVLRRELTGLDVWIMVIDTKGINVWCAAGKGTFGTEEIVNRIECVGLKKIVDHRQIMIPQLGSVGVVAHEVKKQSGFKVIYGPIRANDILEFIKADYKATPEMRQMQFTFYDRVVLTPVEFVMGAKVGLFLMAIFFLLSGLNKNGYSTGLTLDVGFPAMLNIFAAYVGGTVIGPILLPWLLGTSFSVKGFWTGILVFMAMVLLGNTGETLETISWALVIIPLVSFGTMNFTGASTYTSLSGVQKEMKIAMPLQLIGFAVGVILWIVTRFI